MRSLEPDARPDESAEVHQLGAHEVGKVDSPPLTAGEQIVTGGEIPATIFFYFADIQLPDERMIAASKIAKTEGSHAAP